MSYKIFLCTALRCISHTGFEPVEPPLRMRDLQSKERKINNNQSWSNWPIGPVWIFTIHEIVSGLM